MRHPSEGVLRRILDEPAGVAEADRRHVADCAQCLDGLAGARADAALAASALAHENHVDVDAAWQRLSGASTSATRRPTPTRRRTSSRLGRPAVAAVAALAVLAGAGTAAANGWLPIFQTERVAPVGLTTDDLVELPDLSAYGDLEFTSYPDVHAVPDAATAAEESGLDVPSVDELPSGVVGEPEFQVGDKVSATFTFSTARASDAAEAAGETLPTPPPGLDGAAVRLDAGPGVAAVWPSRSGAPALLVARAVAPTAYSSGVPFETVRDYLLSLPGLPEGVAAQLRTFAADGSTLPLPLPADEVTTRTAEVDGMEATLVERRDRTLAAVVWVRDGVVTVVAGSLDADEVLAVAGDL